MAVDTKKLDLDTIMPDKGEVKLCGKTYIVEPPKLKSLIELTKLAQVFKQERVDEPTAIAALERFVKLLYPIIPDLEKDNIDISIDQAGRLLEFLDSLSTPEDKKALEAAGITPANQESKKKSDFSESSPTSLEDTQATP